MDAVLIETIKKNLEKEDVERPKSKHKISKKIREFQQSYPIVWAAIIVVLSSVAVPLILAPIGL